jgi:hypothetical protein
MEDLLMDISLRRADGTFVISLNGLPYHVIDSDPLFLEAAALAAARATAGDPVPLEVPPPQPTPAETLAAERAQMKPFRTAFTFAMKATPATGYAHLLDRVTQTVEAARALDPFADIVIWSDRVTQIVRTHSDMDAFAALFDLSPEEVDDLCRLALQIEAGAP